MIMAIYVGDLEIKKIMLDGVELPDVAIGSIEIPVESGDTPVVSHTYYYQISGGTKQELTYDSTNGYYTTNTVFQPYDKWFIYEDNTDITPNIQLAQSDQFNPIQVDYGEYCLVANYGPARLFFYEDGQGNYSISSELLSIDVYIDGSLAETLSSADGTYLYYPADNIAVASTIDIKYGNISYLVRLQANGGEYQEGPTQGAAMPVCCDANTEVYISYDYGNSTPCFTFDYTWGTDCNPQPIIYADGNQTDYIQDDCTDISFSYPEGTEVYVGYMDGSHYEGIDSITVDGCEIAVSQPFTLPVEVERVNLCGNTLSFSTPNGDYDCSGGGEPFES